MRVMSTWCFGFTPLQPVRLEITISTPTPDFESFWDTRPASNRILRDTNPVGVGEALAPSRAAIASTNAADTSDVRSRSIMVDRWEFTFIAEGFYTVSCRA